MFLNKESFADQLDQFAELFEVTFARKADVPALRWRYLDNPTDGQMHVNTEFVADQMVANYSASPCRLIGAEGKVMGLLSMTTMTHPSQQGKGLFPKLATALYGRAADLGYQMVLGFPNTVSHLAFVEKLGWRDVYEIPMYAIDVGRSESRGVSDVPIIRDDAFAYELTEPAWLKPLLRTERDIARLRWRFRDNPSHEYLRWCINEGGLAHSHIVLKAYADQVDIVDLVPRDATSANALIQVALQYARDCSASRLNYWLPPHVPYRGTLERAGARPGAPVTYFGVRLLGDAERNKMSDAFCYGNWFLQMSDSDVF
jgi:hypothetical protein